METGCWSLPCGFSCAASLHTMPLALIGAGRGSGRIGNNKSPAVRWTAGDFVIQFAL
ncbi:hypothetical protein BACCAP_04029 [Pseudoflavonifractor capillosus ATCC 29799]|uniref:Uncharacterized protein n=1 Tax=Pseudoflavonifractor capillosus ATCC 29799 TaxID=411467 RepID=A6P0L8_9FIRM|nr:hypothetical protein BACCAP_04029 [Pseudoflavonifractor capillosus ATCC 29799]